jgi:hypothetical protein
LFFGGSSRVKHAYQTTRADLRNRQHDLKPLLARYGIALRTAVLADRQRRFDSHLRIPPDAARLARLRHPVTNELSHALDQLEAWLEQHRDRPPAVNADCG